MEKTFPLRRSFILKADVRLWKILGDYPAFQDAKGNELKAELGRILGNPNIVKEMKEIWDMKKPAILSALKSEKKQEIRSLLFSLEDCDPADEKGKNNNNYLFSDNMPIL
ncbi:uncharacterized protein LOC116288543 [Actinia tenebrosa]|uniref:Uncharacterized protein LOC116288543 n=1 Tax=Actinia tenebrosa TaxID=6105 RepID=A0A6P8H7C4_ACTTE|nr:uncharacterized protein LOC116288543 [Actinia tenebrosa]